MPKADSDTSTKPVHRLPADTYEVFCPDDAMEPRYTKGNIAGVSPGTPAEKDDGIYFQVAVPGQEPAQFMKTLISLDDETLRVCQYDPEKELTFAREDVLFVHKVVYYICISPEEVRSMRSN
jgi:hypothetical protein